MRNGNIQKNMMQVRLMKNKSNHSPLKETFEPHLLGELQPPYQQQRDVLGSSSKETECALLNTPWCPPYQYGIVQQGCIPSQKHKLK